MTTLTGNKISEIRQHIAYAVTEMIYANSVNLTDSSLKLERFFKQVLNVVHGLNLTNTNFDICNFPAIDLKDVSRRICYQISATNTKDKIQKTITRFKAKKMYEDFDELRFLFISNDDPKTASDSDIENPLKTKLTFQSVKGLYKEIDGINDESRISEIHRVVTSEVVLPEKKGFLPPIEQPSVNLPSVQRIIDAMNLGNDFESKQLLETDMINLTNIIDLLVPEQKSVIYKFMTLCSFRENRRGIVEPDEIFIPRRSFFRLFSEAECDWLYSLKLFKLFAEYEEYSTDYDSQEDVVTVIYRGELDSTNLFGWMKHVVKGDSTKMREMFCMSNYQCLSI